MFRKILRDLFFGIYSPRIDPNKMSYWSSNSRLKEKASISNKDSILERVLQLDNLRSGGESIFFCRKKTKQKHTGQYYQDS